MDVYIIYIIYKLPHDSSKRATFSTEYAGVGEGQSIMTDLKKLQFWNQKKKLTSFWPPLLYFLPIL